MPIPILYLNEIEENALRAFARGLSNREVLHLGYVPLSGIWVFVGEICRKTGIPTTANTPACQQYIERYEQTMANPVPLTRDQLALLRLWKERNDYIGIADRLKIHIGEIDDKIRDALRQMAIFTKDDKARRLQITSYLAVFHPTTSGIDTVEESLLRKWSTGAPIEQIADECHLSVEAAKAFVHRAATVLQLNSRGRNTQRNLVHSYFRFIDWREAQKSPVTMDDPAF